MSKKRDVLKGIIEERIKFYECEIVLIMTNPDLEDWQKDILLKRNEIDLSREKDELNKLI